MVSRVSFGSIRTFLSFVAFLATVRRAGKPGPFSSNLATQAIDPDHRQNASRAQSQLRRAVTIRDQIIRTEWPWLES